MSVPGTGYRTANSIACEISFHLCQPIVYTTLTNPITASALVQPATIASTNSLYTGAQVIVDSGVNVEVVTVVLVTSPTVFTAIFTLNHLAGIVIQSATFPLQALTDPIFTQLEILSYIARAQNEFLSQVPCVFSFIATPQNVSIGQLYQPAPPNAIQMLRVSASSLSIAISSLTRVSNTVDGVSVNPHGLAIGQKFSVYNPSTESFAGVFQVVTTPTPTTWTYMQVGPNASASGGSVVLWRRLYEVSQVELGCQNPQWRSAHISQIRSWFEDRSGLYQWGVNGIPAANFPVNILSAIRDTDTLALTDGLLVPDLFAHYVRYNALNYALSKDGIMADPMRAKYCRMRYERGILAAQRWLDGIGVIDGVNAMRGQQQGQAAAGGRRNG
jgi:hypothetical protein